MDLAPHVGAAEAGRCRWNRVRAKLHATSRAFEEERAKGFTGMTQAEHRAHSSIRRWCWSPRPRGASGLQQDYRRSLVALGVLVALVLLIACANVANLMTAQAAARAREMALRVSIGAGRWRLVQLVLVESAMLAFLAAAIGGLFAWWSAPFVVSRINPPDNPARLALPADWRVLGFGLALTLGVTFLFGLAPALRASAVKPASALKGGEDPHSRRRLMHALIAAQVAFCFLVLFVAGLFAATFDRLSHQPTGFSAERLLTLDTVAQRAEAAGLWDQVAEHLRAVPGVEAVALAGWPLLDGERLERLRFGERRASRPGRWPTFLDVSPGWVDTMKIRSDRWQGLPPERHVRRVRDCQRDFARQFFNGEDPVGKSFAKGGEHPAIRWWAWSATLPTATCASRSCRWLCSVPSDRCTRSGAADRGSDLHRAHVQRESAGAGIHPAPGSAARAARIPRQQHPHAGGTGAGADRSRAAAGDAGVVLRGCGAAAGGRSDSMACWIIPCCSGGARSASAWRSARRPAISRGG